jgi:hypothetical protein
LLLFGSVRCALPIPPGGDSSNLILCGKTALADEQRKTYCFGNRSVEVSGFAGKGFGQRKKYSHSLPRRFAKIPDEVYI